MDITSISQQGPIPAGRLSSKEGAVAERRPQPAAPLATSTPTSAEDVRDSSASELEEAVSNVEAFTQSIRRDLKFSLDDDSGKVVVKVTDSSTGEVIRQMPSEEALKLAQRLQEARSLLFQAKA
jgi:flagellar protein FlaG